MQKQLHLESDKVKDLENKVAELLEKYKDTDSVLEEKNAEISQLQLTLSETKKNYDNEINNLNSTLTNEKAHHAKEKVLFLKITDILLTSA